MNRLFSSMALACMIMVTPQTNANQYKDFLIGGIKGTYNVLLGAAAANLITNCFNAAHSLKGHPSLSKEDPSEFFETLASRVWHGKWWVPLPLSAGAFAAWLATAASVGEKLQNNDEKFGFLIGSTATVAGIVGWYYHAKK